MIYLVLTVISSGTIALLLKYNNVKQGNDLVLLSGNYLVAAFISWMLILYSHADFSFSTVIAGSALGIFFVIAFFAFSKAVSQAGTALATVSSRLSVIVPVVLSVLWLGERPNFFQAGGFLFGAVTLYLFYLSLKNSKSDSRKFTQYVYLLIVLIGIGINDFGMKLYEFYGLETQMPVFVAAIFSSALIYCVLLVKYKNIQMDTPTLRRGMVLGIPNVFSSIFLLQALNSIPAIIVFPLVNISVIIYAAVFSRILFAEKISKMAFFSILTGTVSILLLTIEIG